MNIVTLALVLPVVMAAGGWIGFYLADMWFEGFTWSKMIRLVLGFAVALAGLSLAVLL